MGERYRLDLTHRDEFSLHGLQNVRLEHGNVCKDGFNGHAGADAVFLDLPAPWEAIPYAKNAFNVSPTMYPAHPSPTSLRGYAALARASSRCSKPRQPSVPRALKVSQPA